MRNASLKGLRVYVAIPNSPPVEVDPPTGAEKYWTRRGIAEWLTGELATETRTLVGTITIIRKGRLASGPRRRRPADRVFGAHAELPHAASAELGERVEGSAPHDAAADQGEES